MDMPASPNNDDVPCKEVGAVEGTPEGLSRGASRPRPRRGLQRSESVATGNGIEKLRRSNTALDNRSGSSRRGPRRAMSLAGPLSEPRHHTMTPRRSSFKRQKQSDDGSETEEGSAKQTRRVSFGESAIREVLKPPKEVKSDIWYDRDELGQLQYKAGKLIRKGQSQINEADDCWRGLETFAKHEEERKADIVSEMEQYRLILLVLQKRSCEDLQQLQQQFLTRFLEEGTKAAAKDAEEALAIYMETMEADEVQEFFSSSTRTSTQLSASAPSLSRTQSDHARVA